MNVVSRGPAEPVARHGDVALVGRDEQLAELWIIRPLARSSGRGACVRSVRDRQDRADSRVPRSREVSSIGAVVFAGRCFQGESVPFSGAQPSGRSKSSQHLTRRLPRRGGRHRRRNFCGAAQITRSSISGPAARPMPAVDGIELRRRGSPRHSANARAAREAQNYFGGWPSTFARADPTGCISKPAAIVAGIPRCSCCWPIVQHLDPLWLLKPVKALYVSSRVRVFFVELQNWIRRCRTAGQPLLRQQPGATARTVPGMPIFGRQSVPPDDSRRWVSMWDLRGPHGSSGSRTCAGI